MPEALFCILMAMIKQGGYGHRDAIIDEAGYEPRSFGRYVLVLLEYGLVIRKFAGRYEITERGKIAVAIEVGRRTKFKAMGMRRSARSGALLKLSSYSHDKPVHRIARARHAANQRWAKHREEGASP